MKKITHVVSPNNQHIPKLCFISIGLFYLKLGAGYIFVNHISNILNWGQKRHIVSICRIQGYIKLPDYADSNNKFFLQRKLR